MVSSIGNGCLRNYLSILLNTHARNTAKQMKIFFHTKNNYEKDDDDDER